MNLDAPDTQLEPQVRKRKPKRIIRGVERQTDRELKRIALTVESHLKLILHIPIDPSLAEPFPIQKETVISFLSINASSDGAEHGSARDASDPSSVDARQHPLHVP